MAQRVIFWCELRKRARFRNFQVYQKNFDACVQTAKMNRDSIERMRFNEPDGAIPKIPDCRDLGYILRDMAKTIQEYSFQLARLSGKFMLLLKTVHFWPKKRPKISIQIEFYATLDRYSMDRLL